MAETAVDAVERVLNPKLDSKPEPWKAPWRERASRITLAEFAAAWLGSASAPPGVSRHVYRNREQHLRMWVLPMLGARQLRAIRPKHLLDLQSHLLKHLSLSTAQGVVESTFASLWAEAERQGLVDSGRHPSRGMRWPRWSPAWPDVYSASEEERIVLVFQRDWPLYAAWVRWAFGTGARPSELAGLRWGDLSADRSTVRVERAIACRELGPPKTARSRRVIGVAEGLRDVIGRPGDPDALIFHTRHGEPIDTGRWTGTYWKRALGRADVRYRKFYLARATYISRALSAGASPLSIAAYCGTSLGMLQTHYASYLQEQILDPLSVALGRKPGVPPSQGTLF